MFEGIISRMRWPHSSVSLMGKSLDNEITTVTLREAISKRTRKPLSRYTVLLEFTPKALEKKRGGGVLSLTLLETVKEL